MTTDQATDQVTVPPTLRSRPRQPGDGTREPPVHRDKCGTYRGYCAHSDADEEPCAACREAARLYQISQRAVRPPEVSARMKARRNAQRAARTMVGAADRATFSRLLAEEKERLTGVQVAKLGRPLTDQETRSLYARARWQALAQMVTDNVDLYQECLAQQLAQRGLA